MTPWLRPAKDAVDPKTGRPNADEQVHKDYTVPIVTAVGAGLCFVFVAGLAVYKQGVVSDYAGSPVRETRGRVVRSVPFVLDGKARTLAHYRVTIRSPQGELVGRYPSALSAGLPVVVRYRTGRSGATWVEGIKPAANMIEPQVKPDMTSGE
ncbi:MAG: hypothetical protein FJX72_16525 [Armatimonadetes bacterium]|nr:hypothetical protein [Armatimonadota bacterium]